MSFSKEDARDVRDLLLDLHDDRESVTHVEIGRIERFVIDALVMAENTKIAREYLSAGHDDWARRVLDRTLGREDKSCK